MDTLQSLFIHLEDLDGQLAPFVSTPQQIHCKLVKEVLFAKQQIRRHVKKNGDAATDCAYQGKLEKFQEGSGYNIDRLNDQYRHAVICPRCSTGDVAVVKNIASVHMGTDFDLHHNRRLKLVSGCGTPKTGKFFCNHCFSKFDPALPAHIVKLCELLFTYY